MTNVAETDATAISDAELEKLKEMFGNELRPWERRVVSAITELQERRRNTLPTSVTDEQVEKEARRLCRQAGLDPDFRQLAPPKQLWWEHFAPQASAALSAASLPPSRDDAQVGVDIPRMENCGRYLAEDNKGQWHYLNHANTWQTFQGPSTIEAAQRQGVKDGNTITRLSGLLNVSQTCVQNSLVAMRLAQAMPGVSEEYDFSFALLECEKTLALIAAAPVTGGATDELVAELREEGKDASDPDDLKTLLLEAALDRIDTLTAKLDEARANAIEECVQVAKSWAKTSRTLASNAMNEATLHHDLAADMAIDIANSLRALSKSEPVKG